MSEPSTAGADTVVMTQAEGSRLDFISEHRDSYLRSGGAEGHIVDFSVIGGLPFTTTLLLGTRGRKSGAPRINPLIYGDTGGRVVIIASKGGADVHPAWYGNMLGTAEVTMQIATQAFRAHWSEAQGAERDTLWTFMVGVFPPFADYARATVRAIPIIVLTPFAPCETLRP